MVDVKMLTFFQGSVIEQKYINPFLKLHRFSAIVFDFEVEW